MCFVQDINALYICVSKNEVGQFFMYFYLLINDCAIWY